MMGRLRKPDPIDKVFHGWDRLGFKGRTARNNPELRGESAKKSAKARGGSGELSRRRGVTPMSPNARHGAPSLGVGTYAG
jgi:hypothetical protein